MRGVGPGSKPCVGPGKKVCPQQSPERSVVHPKGSTQNWHRAVETHSSIPSLFELPLQTVKTEHLLGTVSRQEQTCHWPSTCALGPMTLSCKPASVHHHLQGPALHTHTGSSGHARQPRRCLIPLHGVGVQQTKGHTCKCLVESTHQHGLGQEGIRYALPWRTG